MHILLWWCVLFPCSPRELLLACIPFTGLCCCFLLQTAKQFVPQVIIVQVFEVSLVLSATPGSVRRPLARRYEGRSAIFSHSEADRGFSAWNYSLEVNSKWKRVVFKMDQCLPETLFVCSSQVNFSSSISKNIRSFELYECKSKFCLSLDRKTSIERSFPNLGNDLLIALKSIPCLFVSNDFLG